MCGSLKTSLLLQYCGNQGEIEIKLQDNVVSEEVFYCRYVSKYILYP